MKNAVVGALLMAVCLVSPKGSSFGEETPAVPADSALERAKEVFDRRMARIEEEGRAPEAVDLKEALMGPYAAIGDSFFWGALRSFSAVGAVIVAFTGTFPAPLAFLLLYSPAHFWVRGKGFLEGYRRGKSGIDFIRGLDLPGAAGRIRFLSLILMNVLAN
ncbi:MAG: PTS system mannose/fructose/sorbose family transporter subunit IID [Planctomycetota bacterium]